MRRPEKPLCKCLSHLCMGVIRHDHRFIVRILFFALAHNFVCVLGVLSLLAVIQPRMFAVCLFLPHLPFSQLSKSLSLPIRYVQSSACLCTFRCVVLLLAVYSLTHFPASFFFCSCLNHFLYVLRVRKFGVLIISHCTRLSCVLF